MRLFLVILFCFSYLQADENDKNKIFNEKTFSGPMGMGLSKSYEMGEKKICFYNTINGQEKLILNDNQKNCPQNLKKSKTLKKFNE